MTPLEICIPASGVLAMVAAINFLHNSWTGFTDYADRRATYSQGDRRYQDQKANLIFINFYRFLAAVAYAVFIFWLTGVLFE